LLLTFAIYLHTTRRGKLAVWAKLLEALLLRGDEHVLDMGCGRGAVLTMVAKLVPGPGRGAGLVDLRPVGQPSGGDAVQSGCRTCERPVRAQDRRHARHADSDESFDLVVSSMAIHNIDENNLRNHQRRLKAIDEAVRVLKPGGRLIIADFWSSVYARHLPQQGMLEVRQWSLGCVSGTCRAFGAGVLTAVKPQ
jgi:arsenite methyltransferase